MLEGRYTAELLQKEVFEDENKTNTETSKLTQTYKFVAMVISSNNGYILVEHRNKFKVGDILEVLSPGENFNKTFQIEEILDLNKNKIVEVKKIKQRVYIKSNLILHENDILRMKEEHEN